MIKIEKGLEPEILATNASAWEQVLIDHELAGTSPTVVELNRYNHPDVKAALLDEVHDKCAYCESKFRHVEPGDIEHIVPKKLGSQWRYRWENLTIACSVCNTKKGIRQNLIDPNVDDPADMFLICGPAILPHPDQPRALATEVALDLNRRSLLDKRSERLRALHRMLTIATSQANAELREILLDELRVKEVRDDVEFAAMSRAYVSDLIARGLMAAPC